MHSHGAQNPTGLAGLHQTAGRPDHGVADPAKHVNSTAASRKRRHEESQLELIEMKKDLLRVSKYVHERGKEPGFEQVDKIY